MNNALFHLSARRMSFEETQPSLDFSMQHHHVHNYAELYFLLEGERYYFIEQDTYLLKPGMVVFVKPEEIHKTSRTNNSCGHHRFLITIESDMLQYFFAFSALSNIKDFESMPGGAVKFSKSDWQRSMTIIDAIKQEGAREKTKDDTILLLLSLELYALFVRNHQKQNNISVDKSPMYSTQIHTHQLVHNVSSYLQNHFMENTSLEEIADQFFISKSYLTRIFKSNTGFTIKEYLTFCRIRKAKALLQDTNYSITKVSELCGFSNVTYFEKIFKNVTQLTPLKYRKLKNF